MNWVSVAGFLGLGDFVIGMMENNNFLEGLGLGILIGALFIAVERDKEIGGKKNKK